MYDKQHSEHHLMTLEEAVGLASKSSNQQVCLKINTGENETIVNLRLAEVQGVSKGQQLIYLHDVTNFLKA